MKIGLFITARLGSSRLKAKHLQLIQGKPVLSFLVQRVRNAFSKEIAANEAMLAIVSGCREDNEGLEHVDLGTTVFFGDEHNVPLRHVQAARRLGVDAIVSIDGDDTLCSPAAMRAVYSALEARRSFVKTMRLPLGMNSWGYSLEALERGVSNTSADVLETGWGRIFDSEELTSIELADLDDSRIRATLDYAEDLEFFKRIIEDVPFWSELSDAELVREIISRKIFESNASKIEEYWSNFSKGIQMEESL